MAMNMEATEINWEFGLYDVMDNISKYLNLKELRTLAKVSKSWRKAALREKGNRFYMQQLRLFYPAKLKVSMLKVKPHASVLIYDGELEDSLMLNSSHLPKNPVAECFKEKLSEKMIALKVNKCLSTQNVDFEGVNEHCKLNLAGNFNLLGLFFPSMKRHASVQVAWEPIDVTLLSTDERVDYLATELGLRENNGKKSTLLIFTHSRRGFETADALARYGNQEDTTFWMGMFQEIPIAVKCNSYKSTRSIVALKISGPSAESWSTIIDSRLSRDETELKLHELKERVRRRRHCGGLFYSPASNAYGDSREIMRNVRRIFPDIPFVGLFNSKLWSGAGSFLDLPDDNFLKSMNCLAVIIISYG